PSVYDLSAWYPPNFNAFLISADPKNNKSLSPSINLVTSMTLPVLSAANAWISNEAAIGCRLERVTAWYIDWVLSLEYSEKDTLRINNLCFAPFSNRITVWFTGSPA